MRALFCQPVFSNFEFYASNYASVFAFKYLSNFGNNANQFDVAGKHRYIVKHVITKSSYFLNQQPQIDPCTKFQLDLTKNRGVVFLLQMIML